MDTFSEAQIELDVEGRKIISKGSGNGPVNALDKALRKDLGLYNEYLKRSRKKIVKAIRFFNDYAVCKICILHVHNVVD